MITTYSLFFTGFVVLILGAKWLVDGAASIGKKSGLPQMVIGLTIVALGTSLPELIINVFASLEGSSDLAIGNVLGSNIINTLFIIGITAVIFPIKMPGLKCRTDVLFSLFAIIILIVIANDTFFGRTHNKIDVVDGIILIILMLGFLYYTFFKSKNQQDESTDNGIRELTTIKSVGLITAGIAGLFFGGKWIVGGVDQIALDFELTQSVIGLTLIAIATSLPELVTSILAALKRNTDLAIGNAVGSNIFNILLVLGVSAIIKPIDYNTSLNFEMAILLISGLLLVLFIQLNIGGLKRTISRMEGAIMLILYICFISWTLFFH